MQNEKDKYIVQKYRENEEMMILVYAQWCVNNGLDPKVLYNLAYPKQQTPSLLDDVMASTVSKDESEEITSGLVIQLLQMYGNDDLAFVIQAKVETMKSESNMNFDKMDNEPY